MITRRLRNAGPAPPVLITLVLILLIVAACAGPKSSAPRPVDDPAPANQQTRIEPASESPATVESSAPVAALGTDVTAPDPELTIAPAGEAAIPPINDDPHQLMGLAPHAVNRLLGPPSLLRTEAPAEVWQYTAEDCVLDIYLYAEEKMPDRSTVTYYEIRRSDRAESGARACFGEIIQSWNNTSGNTP